MFLSLFLFLFCVYFYFYFVFFNFLNFILFNFFIFLTVDIQASRGDLEALPVAVHDDKTLTLRMYVHDIYKYIKV